jgi:hypothetical protein
MSPKSSLPIRVRIGFSRMSDGDLQTRTEKAAEGAMDPRLSGSPISAADLKTAADEFREASIAALEGGKVARAAVVTSRKNLIQMLRQYSIYVDVQAEGDPELILAAGLADDLVTPSSTPVARDPIIRKTFRTGQSGQIGVFIKAMPGSSGYQLQSAECKDDIPQAWGEPIPVSNVKSATIISGLPPAVKYAFRVRAQIGNRYTDWSDYVTIICT